ncbi:Glycosyl transferase group 1 [Tumidithrix helvetica PCC 7403]|uniref:glycosyltransferase n=1 Tax=Tumidithrix helvetica TaxID=3457545 RepID=UPI003CADE1B4
MMKVLHLPTYTGGHSWGLAQGEKTFGLDSFVLFKSNDWLLYPCDIDLGLDKISSPILKFAKLAKTFLEIRSQYDVFHFNFGSSLFHSPHNHLNHLELPFYPKEAKLFATYNGCDIRQKYPTMLRTKIAACHNADCYNGQCNSGSLDRFRQQGIQKMQQYVQHIWALNPDLMYFLPHEKSSFLPYAISLDGIEPVVPKVHRKKLKIVHAPTNRAAKGSDYILAAIAQLQKTHSEYFDFAIVEKIPHTQALQLYREADLVIDQILIGWYGGFAVEVMAMGKPVIARIAQADLHFLPPQMAKDVQETVIHADPNSIYEVLRHCLEDRQMLERHAEASIDYARKWHHPKCVASLTKQQYEM